MTGLNDLKVDDQCWRINSIGTTAFLCKVVDVSARSVRVVDVAHTATNVGLFWYDKETGRAAGRSDTEPAPRLVPYDYPVISTLRARNVLDATARKHRSHRKQVSELLAKLPGTSEEWGAVYNLLEEWEDWSIEVEEADAKADADEVEPVLVARARRAP